MVKKKVTVKNPTGLSIKPTEYLNRIAMRYHANATFEYGGGNATANVKSILSVLGSGIKCGDEIILICSGADEGEALDALVEAVESGLGE